MNKQLLDKIREKREFSQLPEKDIENAFSHYEKIQASDDEKIKLTKELLRKVFSAFISQKLLSLKNKDTEWILRKHISTRERLPYYGKIYSRIFGEEKIASVIDLGAGINGFSYDYLGRKKKYTAIESVGQLVELMNFYFGKEKLNARAIHLSLFETEKVKKTIEEEKKPRIVFLFKVIDALESLKPNYSKELISEIAEIADKIVVSFATRSLGSREKFRAKRNWIVDFVKEHFNLLDDFELGGERYLVFNK
ncbi:MAG: hypothetical protein M1416_00565 [Candidatus Pacearchaeota archaeon]|nr:hypothetical protein [Candidatus Pacearchaeota archaeon]